MIIFISSTNVEIKDTWIKCCKTTHFVYVRHRVVWHTEVLDHSGHQSLQYRTELGNQHANCSYQTITMGNLSLCTVKNSEQRYRQTQLENCWHFHIHILWKLQVCRVANTCHYKVDVKDNWNSEWEWLEIVPHSNTHSITWHFQIGEAMHLTKNWFHRACKYLHYKVDRILPPSF